MNSETHHSRPLAVQFIACHSPFIILTAAAMAACYWAAGPTLGLFFGGFFVATFLVPAADRGRAFADVAVVLLVIALFWLIAIFQTPDTFLQWMQLIFVLMAYIAALAGLTLVLSRRGMPRIFASAATIVVSLIWLTWPVWLSPQFPKISSRTIDLLVAVHPPLVANGILKNEPPWTERTVAYRMTRLNQDVPIHLPGNGIACIVAHGLIGGVLLAVALRPRRDGREAI